MRVTAAQIEGFGTGIYAAFSSNATMSVSESVFINCKEGINLAGDTSLTLSHVAFNITDASLSVDHPVGMMLTGAGDVRIDHTLFYGHATGLQAFSGTTTITNSLFQHNLLGIDFALAEPTAANDRSPFIVMHSAFDNVQMDMQIEGSTWLVTDNICQSAVSNRVFCSSDCVVDNNIGCNFL